MYPSLPRPFFVLAPMYDVADTVFRRVVAGTAAPDLFVTEFVNVDGLQSPGREHLRARLRFTAAEQPILAQIWGSNPEHYRTTAAELVEMGFTGIDINMGCPDKAVVKNGCCSALINNRERASEIIQATQEGAAGRVPVSVKTRLGFGAIDHTWHEHLLGHKLAMLSIHGRTTRQMSQGAADWAAIKHVRELRDELAPETLIVGNGDVMSRQHGLELAAQSGVDGVMIGRGIFADPFAFAEQSPWGQYPREQRIKLFRDHVVLFADTWQHRERPVVTLNKFCKIYIQGFAGAKEMREQLMAAGSTEELLSQLDAALA